MFFPALTLAFRYKLGLVGEKAIKMLNVVQIIARFRARFRVQSVSREKWLVSFLGIYARDVSADFR